MKPRDNEAWVLGRRAMVSSLIVSHVWGTILIIAVLQGHEGGVISTMFEAVCWQIFATMAVLVGGKAWKEFAPLKWGSRIAGEQDVRSTEDTDPVTTDAYSRGPGTGGGRRGGRMAAPYNRRPDDDGDDPADGN